MARRLTIAIDGPGSAGKGTVARSVARELGYQYVDTGAMYRGVAVCAASQGVPWTDERALAGLASNLRFGFGWDGDNLTVEIDGEDVTKSIRSEEAGKGASQVSALVGVRQALLGLQRSLAEQGGVVMDGRDIGTVVFPDAEVKVYLDADLDERARRRHDEIVRRGDVVSFERVKQDLAERDNRDLTRKNAPLMVADDAVVLDTTSLTIRQVVERVLSLIDTRSSTN